MYISNLTSFQKKAIATILAVAALALISIVTAEVFPQLPCYPILLYGGISLFTFSTILGSIIVKKSQKSSSLKGKPQPSIVRRAFSTSKAQPKAITKQDLIHRLNSDYTKALELYISLKPTLSPEMDQIAIEKCLCILQYDMSPDEQIRNFEQAIVNETSHFHLTALGICYILKPDLFPNRDVTKKANYFFKRSVEANWSVALFAYSILYGSGHENMGIPKDEIVALNYLYKAADCKMLTACLTLASLYDPSCTHQHDSIKKSWDMAKEYYRKGVSENEIDLRNFFNIDPMLPMYIYIRLKSFNIMPSERFEQFLLEEFMQKTLTMWISPDDKNLLALEELLKEETSFVHLTALGALYLWTRQTPKHQAMDYFAAGIQTNYPPSSFFASCAFNSGLLGDTPNKEKAFNHLQTSANQGFVMAQFTLATIYHRLTDKSFDREKNLFLHPQSSLFSMNFESFGLEKDLIQAKHWYQLAADQGFAQAQLNLGAMIYETHENDKEAFTLFCKAATQQYSLSYAWMSTCYAEGRGVVKDEAQAKVFSARA